MGRLYIINSNEKCASVLQCAFAVFESLYLNTIVLQ